MKTIIALILLSLFSRNTFAQDHTQWGLPEGAKMRLGKGILSGSIAYSPDGTRLAVASTIGIWLYDTTTYQEVALPTEHAFWVSDVVFSPDGKTIASASSDHTVRLWDAHTGERKQTLKGHTSTVESVVFSPDGKTIASASSDSPVQRSDHTVRLWDAHTGEHKQTFKKHYAISIAFSPDGKTIASASRDQVRLWDAHTGEHKQTLKGPDRIYDFAFSPDGQTIASVNSGRTILLWDAHTGEHKQTFKTHYAIHIAFSPDGQTIASVGGDGTILLWDACTGEYRQTFKRHTSRVTTSIAFSPDGQTIASGSWDGTILLWDIVEPPVDISVPLGFAVERWSSLEPVAMDFIANPEYGTGIMGATIGNAASDDGEVLLWRLSAGGKELVARISTPLINAVPTVRFDRTGVFDNKLFVTINAGQAGQRTTRVAIVEPSGEFRDAINIYNENSTQASIEFINLPGYPAGAYIAVLNNLRDFVVFCILFVGCSSA